MCTNTAVSKSKSRDVVVCCAFSQALDVQRERKRFENQRFAVQRSAGRLAAVLSGMSCVLSTRAIIVLIYCHDFNIL